MAAPVGDLIALAPSHMRPKVSEFESPTAYFLSSRIRRFPALANCPGGELFEALIPN